MTVMQSRNPLVGGLPAGHFASLPGHIIPANYVALYTCWMGSLYDRRILEPTGNILPAEYALV